MYSVKYKKANVRLMHRTVEYVNDKVFQRCLVYGQTSGEWAQAVQIVRFTMTAEYCLGSKMRLCHNPGHSRRTSLGPYSDHRQPLWVVSFQLKASSHPKVLEVEVVVVDMNNNNPPRTVIRLRTISNLATMHL